MTIFALSSAPGQSGVAVFRISGPETKEILGCITNSPLPEPRKATLLKINNINNSMLIDEGIVLWFPGPNSYTGEDMAELHVHGSRGVIIEIQNNLLSTKKCRIAEAGEFTEVVKKIIFQGKPYNEDNVFHMKRELGDICWYLAQAFMALDTNFDEILDMNIEKLSARYPDGAFNEYYSENRKEGDV